MSANTSPDNIVYPVSTDQIAPLETVLATMATSMQTALTGQGKYFVAAVDNAAARNALFPVPVQGNRVYRKDLGVEEAYFALYNATTNVGGRAAAGWAVPGNIDVVVNTLVDSPPVGAQMIHYYKHSAGATNASGLLSEVFTTPFPNGVCHIFFSGNSGSAVPPVLNNKMLTKTGFTIAVPSAPSTSIDYSYHAIGW